MKFKFQHVSQVHGRLGCIYDVERLPSFKLETPNLVFFTKGGCIPHLTYDVMQLLTTADLPLQYPLSNLLDLTSAIEKFGKGLASFVGLPEYFTYCCLQDPTACQKQGHNREGFATVFGRRGKSFISSEDYMDMMENFAPDMYVTMSDSATNLESRSRRLNNAMITTMRSFSYCFQRHTSSTVLKNKGLIAAISGGYDAELRQQCAEFMSPFPVLGYLLDGFYTNGAVTLTTPHEPVMNTISITLSYLPEEKLKIIHGAWDPKLVLKMVKLGIDLFDTTYPFIAAEKGFALTFNYQASNLFDNDVRLSTSLVENENTSEDILEKLTDLNIQKVEDDDFLIGLKNSPYMTDLRDKKYADDLNPLVSKCQCLCCRKHTRAYIYHLLRTQELLGYVLLTIHNLHHYVKFFEHIRCKLKSCSENETPVSHIQNGM